MVCASTLRFDFAKTKIALYKKYPLLLLLHVIGPHAIDGTPFCSRLHNVLWSWMCSPKLGSQGGDWQVPGTQTAAAVGVGSSAVIRHHVWAVWLGWGHLQHHWPALSAQASGCEHPQQPHTSLASSLHCNCNYVKGLLSNAYTQHEPEALNTKAIWSTKICTEPRAHWNPTDYISQYTTLHSTSFSSLPTHAYIEVHACMLHTHTCMHAHMHMDVYFQEVLFSHYEIVSTWTTFVVFQ